MSAYLFKENDEIVGIFDDKTKFKNSTFHYILDSLISKGMFKTKKQCGLKIKDDLKMLYSENNYSFLYNGQKFTKVTMDMNKVLCLTIPRQYTSEINFIFFKKEDLVKPIPLLSVSDLLKKNE